MKIPKEAINEMNKIHNELFGIKRKFPHSCDTQGCRNKGVVLMKHKKHKSVNLWQCKKCAKGEWTEEWYEEVFIKRNSKNEGSP